jgi:hypothetical protein
MIYESGNLPPAGTGIPSGVPDHEGLIVPLPLNGLALVVIFLKMTAFLSCVFLYPEAADVKFHHTSERAEIVPAPETQGGVHR